MVLLLNKATSLSHDFLTLSKEYTAEIRFGMRTDTMDMEGNITGKTEVNELDLEKLGKILEGFTGRIRQVVPMYSAVKHRGRPLYEFARKGVDIKRRPRPVDISEIKILKQDKYLLTLKIKCSSGTYIRSLAHDIGIEYGTGAVLSKLRRTKIGNMYVGTAAGIGDIKDMGGCKELPSNLSWLKSLYDIFNEYPSLSVRQDYLKRIRNGSRLTAEMVEKKSEILSIMKTGVKTFPDIITIRSADGKIIAIHRMLQGTEKNNIKSLDEDLTKSVVIF